MFARARRRLQERRLPVVRWQTCMRNKDGSFSIYGQAEDLPVKLLKIANTDWLYSHAWVRAHIEGRWRVFIINQTTHGPWGLLDWSAEERDPFIRRHTIRPEDLPAEV